MRGYRPLVLRCNVCRRPAMLAEHTSPGVYRLWCDQHYDDGTEVVQREWVPEWMDQAACLGAEIHGIHHGTFTKRYCVRCPVWRRCLDMAMRAEDTGVTGHEARRKDDQPELPADRWLVYGGLSPKERRLHRDDAVAYAESKLFELAMTELGKEDP